MPNIGILVLKNTPRVARMFDSAWLDYYSNTKRAIRKHPGKDQNKVVYAMQHFGGRIGAGFGSNTYKFNTKHDKDGKTDKMEMSSSNNKRLNWRFIPVTQAVLIDKLFKFLDQAVELGGQATARILAGMIV